MEIFFTSPGVLLEKFASRLDRVSGSFVANGQHYNPCALIVCLHGDRKNMLQVCKSLSLALSDALGNGCRHVQCMFCDECDIFIASLTSRIDVMSSMKTIPAAIYNQSLHV